MKSRCKIISFMLLCMLCCAEPVFCADKMGDELQSHRNIFVRIKNISEITDGDELLIGTDYKNGRLYFLSAETYAKSRTKRAAVEFGSAGVAEVKCENKFLIWKLKKKNAGDLYSLYNEELEKYLQANKQNKTDLTLSKQSYPWLLNVDNESNAFNLQNGKEGRRFLSLSYYDSVAVYYGNFVKGNGNNSELQIYKKAHSFLDLEGENKNLSSLNEYALCAGEKIFSGKSECIKDKNFFLSDNTIAPDSSYMHVRIEKKGKNKILIKTKSAVFLSDALSFDSVPFEWEIIKGYLATPSSKKYIVYSFKAHQLELHSAAELSNADGYSPLVLRKIGESPQKSIDEEGHCQLRGAWTAKALSELNLSDVLSLDLSKISLPVSKVTFKHYPERANTVAYVSAKDSANLPENCPFMVICDSGRNYLRNSVVTLTDKQPCSFMYPFWVKANQLKYVRHLIDGNWETICLPFSANIPQNCKMEKFIGRKEYTLSFIPVKEYVKNIPCIIKGRRQDQMGGEVIFSSTSGEAFTGDTRSLMQEKLNPNYKRLYTNENDPKYACCFLSEGGKSFVRTLPGSYLPAFRCYMLLSATTPFAVVRHEREQRPSPGKGYAISGKSVNSAGMRALGIYILNNKKILYKK